MYLVVRFSSSAINTVKKIKVRYGDKTGFALWYKRLEKERFIAGTS